MRVPSPSAVVCASLLFFIALGGLDGHSVELTLTLLGDPAASVLILLHQAHLLQLLEDVPSDFSRALRKHVRPCSTTELASVHFAEALHTNANLNVDLAHHRCSA